MRSNIMPRSAPRGAARTREGRAGDSDPFYPIYEQTMSDDSGKERRRVRVSLDDDDLMAACRVDTFRAGGKGGQHQNTTESGVRLTHEPTGVVVEARDERSQHRNREIALERLKQKLRRMARRRKPRKETKVPRQEKRKRLENKRRRSRIKRLRKPPRRDGTE